MGWRTGWTRLPGDARLSAGDAARLLDARFTTPLTPSGPTAQQAHVTLSRLGIAGGAVYDALVALAAQDAMKSHRSTTVGWLAVTFGAWYS